LRKLPHPGGEIRKGGVAFSRGGVFLCNPLAVCWVILSELFCNPPDVKESSLSANRISVTARVFLTLLAALSIPAFAPRLSAQTTAATFGTVIPLGGTPSDMVLDQSRGLLYLVNSGASRIDIVSTSTNAVVGNIPVSTGPLAEAMSPDNAYLYVTSSTSNTVTVIALGGGGVVQTIAISQPQGIAVGGDGRALISTLSAATPLLIFDRTQATGSQLISVVTPPPPSTPTPLPSTTLTRPTTTFLSKLATTPDGNYIVGITNPTTTTSYMFVYEVSSGSILRSRTVTGQSTVLAISPDGSRFMAGYTMYDIATLSLLGQMNNANAPFPFTAAFSTTANIGGSVFSPDGTTLYGAFNVAATSNPPAPTNSSTLLLSDPNNLAIRLGIRLPESIVAKVVVTADGKNAWSLSQSGLIYLPLSTLYNYPIIQPSATQIFLSQNPCSPGLAQATLNINNLGAGKLTYAVTTISSALTTNVSSGVAPSTITFSMEPGRLVARKPGTNLVTGATGVGGVTAIEGQPLDVAFSAPAAINIPPLVRVYMNYRQSDQRGQIFPVPTIPNNSPLATQITTAANTTLGATLTVAGDQGLQDIVLDQGRNLVYLSNAGYNRIEVFDTVNRVFKTPISVGQLPGQMALSSDGNTLYVAHTGSELIHRVDLTIMKDVGYIGFPPLPRQAGGTTAALLYPQTLATGLYGLQFVMSNGGQWEVLGGTAVPRAADTLTQAAAGNNLLPVSATTRVNMMASPDNSYILTLAGNGEAYLYQGSSDSYVANGVLFSAPIAGFYGPLGAGPAQSYFTLGGLYTNGSLTVLGGTASPSAVSASNPSARHVVATAPYNSTSFLRLTTPVLASFTATPTSDARPIIEQVGINNGSSTVLAVAPENPRFSIFSTSARYNLPPRSMVVDSNNTAYIITLSGLSVVPLTPGGATVPAINATRGVVNATDNSTTLTVGGFINVNGTNLASTATAAALPTPTVLGGSCVTFNDVALPLLKTATGQIQAQIPPTVSAGTNIVQVRSLDHGLQSNPVQVTVAPPSGSVAVAGSANVGTIVPGGRIGIQ